MKLELEENGNSTNNSTIILKAEENLGLNSNEDNFDQIELKVEKETIVNRDDFFGKPVSIKSGSNKKINLTYRKFGNTCAFLYNKDGDPYIVIGPHCIIYYYKL